MSSVRMLWGLLHPARFWFAIALGIGALSSLSEGIGISLLIPVLAQFQGHGAATQLPWIVRHVLPIQPHQQIASILAIIFFLVCLKNLLIYSNRALLAMLDAKAGHKLRCRIFTALMDAPISFWDRRDPGKVIDTLANESWRTAQAFQVLSGLMVAAMTALVFSALLLLISWKLTAIVFLGLALISGVIRAATRPIKAFGDEAVQVNAELGARMWDGVAGVRSIHAFSLEERKRQRFSDVSDQVRKAFLLLELRSGLVPPASEVMHVALLIGLLVFLLPQAGAGPTELVFGLLLLRLQPNVSNLQAGWTNFLGMSASFKDVADLLESAQAKRIGRTGVPFQHIGHSLTFDRVLFRYEGESRAALEDVSMIIPAGRMTAILGPSGAGKSTLMHLICRFHEVSGGTIRVDGNPLDTYDVMSWRSRIGLAGQDTHLFSASVRENIALGASEATDEQITRAAMLAHAHEFILQLPDGYDTRVGERGTRLSGGQRQRIALARAFVREPEILVLDEATNALDSTTDEAVSSALREMQGRMTIIIVAHRLSTIARAEHAVVLNEGRVVQQGSPADLMAVAGPFSQLFRMPGPNLEEADLCGTS